jgi:ABC-2 type transport system permease protein
VGSALAMVRSQWQAASTYRLRLVISIVSLGVTVIPLYFVANALQPVMAESIATQGGEYFGFLLLGMVTFMLIPTAVNALPGAVGGGINTGVLEALLGTRAGLPAILSGMIGYSLGWTALRSTVLLLTGWAMGAELVWSHLLQGALILALIVLAYLPIGLIGSALVIAFRTAGPLGQGVLALSALLGGVYYPTTVIPSWIQAVSDFVPLTYGLRALRRTLLEGSSLASVLPELGILLAFIVGLFAVGSIGFWWAMRYARREGTLAQY